MHATYSTGAFERILSLSSHICFELPFCCPVEPEFLPPPHILSVVKGQVLQTAWDLFAIEVCAAMSHPRPIFWIFWSYPNPAFFLLVSLSLSYFFPLSDRKSLVHSGKGELNSPLPAHSNPGSGLSLQTQWGLENWTWDNCVAIPFLL